MLADGPTEQEATIATIVNYSNKGIATNGANSYQPRKGTGVVFEEKRILSAVCSNCIATV